ncbi:hypothetical protein [Massilia violaceinigra]|uniref:hypothetical protein n=1 Tax=Massilia violaceinigra TaxID=2045208 RepID=UPI0012FD96CB|nr:hypothetical protein [Massilia violaceinigra]
MTTAAYHLVSQHFGKLVSTIIVDESQRGILRFSGGGLKKHSVDFLFAVANFSRIPSEMCLTEFIVRRAIAQMHQMHRKGELRIPSSALQLSMQNVLWIGDLLHVPYGGATNGVDPSANPFSQRDSPDNDRAGLGQVSLASQP